MKRVYSLLCLSFLLMSCNQFSDPISNWSGTCEEAKTDWAKINSKANVGRSIASTASPKEGFDINFSKANLSCVEWAVSNHSYCNELNHTKNYDKSTNYELCMMSSLSSVFKN